MLAPVFAFYLGNLVNEELTIGGVTSAHYTGDFAYTKLESTSYWQVNLDGLKLNGAAAGSTPYAIVDAGTSLLAGPTTDVMSNCCLVELVDHHLFKPRVLRRSQCCGHRCVHRRRDGARAPGRILC